MSRLQFEADRLRGTVARCPQCHQEFVLSSGLLVDPRHTYRVYLPDDKGGWRFDWGHPVHSPSFCKLPSP